MSDPTLGDVLRARHLRFGWCQLLGFLLLGLALEALHGFKAGLYLDVANETRRMLWTLAHAHGSLLGLVHVAFAVSVPALLGPRDGWLRIASPCLMTGGLLLPAGFFVGGAVIYGGDPGPGVLLVPPGAALTAFAVALTAGAALSKRPRA